jgi:hypothetical protein
MNYQRRKIRPRQPAIPSTPAHSGVQGSGSSAGMGHKGTVGNGVPSDACKGAQGSMGGKKSY